MRLVQLTPGTGGFYCGSCMRDNALVAALRRGGHDATLVPLYLPFALDEDNAADAPLFFGGINVYLQEKFALFRRTPRRLDRLFDAGGPLALSAKLAGMTRPAALGALTVSMLRGEEGRQAKELERLVTWLAEQPRYDAVCLSNALLLGTARRIKEALRVPVVCTLQGEDTFVDALPSPHREAAWETMSDRARGVDAFIAVSAYHRDRMTERLNLDRTRVHVVHNGIALHGYEAEHEPPSTPTVGYLARLCRDKGVARLVDAYIELRRRNSVPGLRLHLAGAMTAADKPLLAQLESRLRKAGVMDDARITPNLNRDDKIRFLQGLTVFSVPAVYGESFGLYVLEALAAGVPVVQPRSGAFPELLAATGGGILCEVEPPAAYADAIESLLLDPARARALGQQGRRAVFERFSVERMAREVAAVLQNAITT